MPTFRSDKRSFRRFGRVIRFDGGTYETSDPREVAWLRGRGDVEEVRVDITSSVVPERITVEVEPDEAVAPVADPDQPDETE